MDLYGLAGVAYAPLAGQDRAEQVREREREAERVCVRAREHVPIEAAARSLAYGLDLCLALRE